MSSSREARGHDAAGTDRRSFLQASGAVATGLAVTAVPVAGLALPGVAGARQLGDAVHPSGDVPGETVMAFVHDAEKGHVTVVSGISERTYHDPTLAKRLLDAAHAQIA